MSCVRILNRNYASPTAAANAYKSSENSSYPVSNIYDIYRRAKVWRTAGYFDIASGSNTIVFREQAGVDLTATLTVDEYTTTALFMAEVKAALEAAGVATYTVTQESDFRFKILSDLGGGATVFELRWASSTGMAAVMGFDSVNLSGAAFYVADVIALHTSEWLKWDMGVPLNPTDFVLCSQRNSFLKLSPNAVVKLQGNDTDNWTAPQFDQTLTFNSKLLYTGAEAGLDTSPRRFWRVVIEDKQNPYGYLEFALVFLGTSDDIDRGCVQFPLRSEQIDLSETTRAEAGNTFTDIRPQTCAIDLEWSGLTPTDVETLKGKFASFGIHTPFFVTIDSVGAFSTSANEWVRWVKNASPPRSDLVSPSNFQMSMRVLEEI